ncbi:sensor histidine kinase [uncultured Psychroserpens sp.]|uniref:sensor histidine kinase n=1 Tax=uncultured Psychroserpens sp. TaxID=255436 RepID=UPI00262EB94E|nr:histidine kinase [uncultured Psychroserpens sp.]
MNAIFKNINNPNFVKVEIDKTLAIIIIVYYTLFEIFSVFNALFINKVRHYKNPELQLPTFLIEVYIIDWLVVLTFMYLVVKLIKLFRFYKIHVIIQLLFHVVLSILIGVFISYISYLFLLATNNLPIIENVSHYIIYRIILVSPDNFLVYFSLLSIIYLYNYFKNLSTYKSQQSELKSQLTQVKMSLLKSQLDPHFIFNTLNNISALIDIDAGQAQQKIANLSSLLRDIIKIKTENLIPLKLELSILERYIDLILTRFSEDLIIKKQIDEALNEVLIPNLMIQSIIENSIKHGYSYEIKNLTISIHLFETKERLNLIIRNNGKYLEQTFDSLLKYSDGIGIKNIFSRLETIYGSGNFSMSMNNINDAQGVETKISIPMRY